MPRKGKGRVRRGMRVRLSPATNGRGGFRRTGTADRTWGRASFGSFFPVRKLVTLEYNGNYLLSSTSSAIAVEQFRANSLYDPDYTGTGHQYMGSDILASMYQQYCVVGLVCKWKMINYTTAPAIYSIRGANIGSTPTDCTLEMERMLGTGGLIEPNGIKSGTYRINCKKLGGVSGQTYEALYQSTIATNPGNTLWLNFAMQGMDGAIPTKCALQVTLYAKVIYNQPYNQSQN